MRISTADTGAPFALLGAGFTGRSPVLIRPLIRSASKPRVAFLAYEDDPASPALFTGEVFALDELTADPQGIRPEIELDERGHRGAVEEIRAAIAAGDVYQVNLTLRARVRCASGAALLSRMSAAGLPPFAAWVRLPGGREFVSASPELFFEIEGSRIRCRPMKGTAPCGSAAGLLASEKDRSELDMITDLIRNDLTPVCRPRGVRVTAERRLVPLSYAVQTVSEVEGDLLPEHGFREALRTLHPGGSITGAPKEAAREMIARLESSPRGPYCGTLGYLAGDRAVFSLLIRTAWRAGAGSEWAYGVGGGIVWDSDPAAELEEIRVKLGALA